MSKRKIELKWGGFNMSCGCSATKIILRFEIWDDEDRKALLSKVRKQNPHFINFYAEVEEN